MSSKSNLLRRTAVTLLVYLLPQAPVAESQIAESMIPEERAFEVISVSARELPNLWACPVERVAAWSCWGLCAPILAQVDERDPQGRWVLDVGLDDSQDEQRGGFDPTDWVLVPLVDLGNRASLPPTGAAYAVRVSDPSATFTRWFYLGCSKGNDRLAIPGSARVEAKPHLDEIQMRRMTVKFCGALPKWMSVDDGPNLLDRLKLRAQARFLFGLVTVRRNESHVQGQVLGWRAGPLRAIRAQEHWLYLGSGIRTPVFRSYAIFYPDYLDIPVRLRLRFPATHFFSSIRVQGYIDFRGLWGWSLLLPDDGETYLIDGQTSPQERALAYRNPAWFALRGPEVTMIQYFGLSPSLQSLKRRFLYRDDKTAAFPPESVQGEVPAVGYELSEWQGVGSGTHSLHVTSFVVPRGVPPARVIAAQRQPLRIAVEPLP